MTRDMGSITHRNGRYRVDMRRETHRECKAFASKVEAACDAGQIVVSLGAVTMSDDNNVTTIPP